MIRCRRFELWAIGFALCPLVFCAIARADVFNMAPGLTNLQFITVGNPGNAPDTRFNGISVGSVDHVYQIGKYETTAGQYTEFLNSVAKADPLGLYSPAMGDPNVNFQGANILRSGSSPNFSYSVAADWANRPVNYVSFWDAARFTNWLQNGQPIGPEGTGTTENGAYHDIGNDALFGRNVGARFFIPTEDEWYKAAYHKSSARLSASYNNYPTGSNTAPINTLPDPGRHANFFDAYGTGNGGYTVGGPYWRTNAGEYSNSPSPYGTFDQGGNVWEWNETPVFGTARGLRGGSFVDLSDNLQASVRYFILYDPTREVSYVGFRAAGFVPEPGCLTLCVLGAAMLTMRRGVRRRGWLLAN